MATPLLRKQFSFTVDDFLSSRKGRPKLGRPYAFMLRHVFFDYSGAVRDCFVVKQRGMTESVTPLLHFIL